MSFRREPENASVPIEIDIPSVDEVDSMTDRAIDLVLARFVFGMPIFKRNIHVTKSDEHIDVYDTVKDNRAVPVPYYTKQGTYLGSILNTLSRQGHIRMEGQPDGNHYVTLDPFANTRSFGTMQCALARCLVKVTILEHTRSTKPLSNANIEANSGA